MHCVSNTRGELLSFQARVCGWIISCSAAKTAVAADTHQQNRVLLVCVFIERIISSLCALDALYLTWVLILIAPIDGISK